MSQPCCCLNCSPLKSLPVDLPTTLSNAGVAAENLVAAFQDRDASLLAVARNSESAQTFLQALEIGCGVVLQTEDPAEVRQLAKFVSQQSEASQQLEYEEATVASVKPVGMGDRWVQHALQSACHHTPRQVGSSHPHIQRI